MIRVSDREVRLETAHEAWAKESFDELLDEGYTIDEAYRIIEKNFGPDITDPEFWEWLADR